MLILVGPSASGKTQIVKILREKYGLNKMVTYTSRAMRPGEKEGIDYFFLTKEEFEKRINEGFFIEYVVYNGNYYGTSLSQVSNDKVVILEPTGLKHYINKIRDEVKVAFLRCSTEIVRIRMKERGDDPEVIRKRLLLDGEVFNKDIMKLADWVIDTSASNIYDNASEIYLLYKDNIK
ncbi:MAG: AAA family ATPase [Bacilli bacterium]|nr:AAA family ATPase [Bacilli bacterium]